MRNRTNLKRIAAALAAMVILFGSACTPKDGGDCVYQENFYEGVVAKIYEGGVWLQLEPNGRLLTLANEHVEGTAEKGDAYRVRVNELVEGSCVPSVALEAKRL